MAKNTAKNQLECSKRARKKYNDENYKYQTIAFKNEELKEVELYCKKFDISKNSLFKRAIMEYIEKSVD